MKGPTLTVGSQTNTAEIQTFLAGLDKNAKLRAKQDPQGNTILYTSAKRSSLVSKLIGRAGQRREAARKVIDRTINQLESGALRGAVNEGMREPTKMGFRDLRGLLSNRPNASLRVGRANLGIEIGKALVETAPLHSSDKSGVPLHKLGDLQASYTLAAQHLSAGNRDEGLKSLGDAIGQAVRENFNEQEKDAFAFSGGIGLRQKISAALEQTLGAKYDEVLPPGKERDSFLREAVFHASGQVLANKQIDENTILIGGETFTKDRSAGDDGRIGEGGFADVYLYQRTKDDGSIEKIAVKFSKPTSDGDELDKQLGEVGREVLVHKAAVRGGADNVIGLLGGLRTADGRIAIALEYAPNGTVHDAIDKLKTAVEGGHISPQAASTVRLTLLQDMAKGLAKLEQEGIVNGDAKPPNVLIGLNGDAKIADLGTAQITKSYVLLESGSIDNPRWLAPEVLAAKKQLASLNSLEPWDLSGLAKHAGQQVRDAMGLPKGAPLTRRDRRLVDNLLSPIVESRKQKVAAGNKGDAWALGVSGFTLLYGREPVDSSFATDVIQGVSKFGEDASNRAISGNAGAFAAPSGFGAEDDLINQLLHPDPDQRLTAQEALDHRAFSASGVGSDTARDLIKAMMTGDVAGMAQASNDLKPRP